MTKKPFGSGYFGEWICDEFNLPAYRYTCDQINDHKAVTPMNKKWRSNTEHLHQVGNDRLVAVASNYGYIQVRQDEGCPKYLNEYNPIYGHYAGGFGYLTDGKDILSTHYPGNGSSFDRIFGIGYYRKKATIKKFSVDQIVFAPFGDDPILISQIVISNNQEEAVDLRWIEYWGCNIYQFTATSMGALLTDRIKAHPRDIRRAFSEKFLHEFKVINNGKGIQDSKIFKDITEVDKMSRGKPVFKDKFPPKTFLVSLNAKVSSIFTNSRKFFGSGGTSNPEGLKGGIKTDIETTGYDAAMFLECNIHLEPKESKRLYFAYGYVPEGFDTESLLSKYKSNITGLWQKTCEDWKTELIELIINDEPWVNREIIWHNYYLRAAMTYDNFFKEHILSQGHVYQYIIGFQGAARDPLQHALPFVFTNQEIVKNIIRYTLKSLRKNGEIPYAICGSGEILPAPYKPSDLEMWLLWLTSEYVLATRDVEFLDDELPTYPIHRPSAGKATVRDLLRSSYNRFAKKIGTGKHGLQRLSNGDWNDTVIIGHLSPEKHKEIRKQAESVLNAAMSIFTLKKYTEMLDFTGEKEMAEEVFNYFNNQRKAVKSQWMGKWFRRAWLTEELGWIGEDQMWLEPQPWAILGDAVNDKQKEILIQSIDKLVRQPSKIGARLHSKGLESIRNIGDGTNAGIWPSINGTLIMALALVNGDMAWDEWKKNTLAYHADNYPDIWYGIWSGPDTYNSDLSKYPGYTPFDESLVSSEPKTNVKELPGHIGLAWTDFPVFNLHPHAWPLYTTSHLIGVNFTPEGIKLTPKLPKNEFKFSSPLYGFERRQNGYSGWYHPLKEGKWKISLKLNKDEKNKIKILEINGVKKEIVIVDDHLVFEGINKNGSRLEWDILF